MANLMWVGGNAAEIVLNWWLDGYYDFHIAKNSSSEIIVASETSNQDISSSHYSLTNKRLYNIQKDTVEYGRETDTSDTTRLLVRH